MPRLIARSRHIYIAMFDVAAARRFIIAARCPRLAHDRSPIRRLHVLLCCRYGNQRIRLCHHDITMPRYAGFTRHAAAFLRYVTCRVIDVCRRRRRYLSRYATAMPPPPRVLCARLIYASRAI